MFSRFHCLYVCHTVWTAKSIHHMKCNCRFACNIIKTFRGPRHPARAMDRRSACRLSVGQCNLLIAVYTIRMLFVVDRVLSSNIGWLMDIFSLYRLHFGTLVYNNSVIHITSVVEIVSRFLQLNTCFIQIICIVDNRQNGVGKMLINIFNNR